MNRYAPTSRSREGVQSAYDAGLSYFPDNTMAATPLGDISTVAGTIAGSILGGPAGGAAGGSLASAISGIFGGTAVDQARLARVNYFFNLASQGNVAAAQLILGAIPNVSGNEKPMWEAAWSQLQSVAPDVANAANAAGPIALLNNGDTATNYPGMRRVTAAWAAQNPFAAAAGAAGAAVSSFLNPNPAPLVPGQLPIAARPSSSSSLILFGVVVLGVYALTARRRR